jgi:hypothetical protein
VADRLEPPALQAAGATLCCHFPGNGAKKEIAAAEVIENICVPDRRYRAFFYRR